MQSSSLANQSYPSTLDSLLANQSCTKETICIGTYICQTLPIIAISCQAYIFYVSINCISRGASCLWNSSNQQSNRNPTFLSQQSFRHLYAKLLIGQPVVSMQIRFVRRQPVISVHFQFFPPILASLPLHTTILIINQRIAFLVCAKLIDQESVST